MDRKLKLAKGNPSLVQLTPHSHITVSPATCHPVQRSPNMRVADCATVWCLQLIYLNALHLTLFNIYITINITNSFNQMSLSWRYDYLPGP